MNAVRRHRFATGIVLATMLGSRMTFAQPTDDAARAQSLFDDAVRLLETNRFSDACPKLAESLALDPAGGTAVDLAFCYEHDGKLASSLDAYRAALLIAESEGREDRKKTASERIEALEPRVGRIHLVADAEHWPSEGWQVLLDAHVLTPAAITTPLAVDSGRHIITVTAAGKRALVRQVDVTDGSNVAVMIDRLEDVVAPALSPTAKPFSSPTPVPKAALSPVFVLRDDVPRRNWGIGLGASGLGAVGVGAITGIVAANLHAKSDRLCPPSGCTGEGVAAEAEANRAAWVSNVAFVAGVALVGIGTYLFLSARHAKRVPAANDAALGTVVFDLR